MRSVASYAPLDESWLAPAPTGSWSEEEPRPLFFPKRTAAPLPLPLLDEIARSREILAWEDDWDGEGSIGYEETTWKRATDFLRFHAQELARFGVVLPTPRILPGPHGSVDLHWEAGAHELLLNVPTGGQLAGFYGEVAGASSIKGKLDLDSSAVGLFLWLTTKG
jgi:hypothetical protein